MAAGARARAGSHCLITARLLAALLALGSLVPSASAYSAGPDSTSVQRQAERQARQLSAAAGAVDAASASVDRLKARWPASTAIDQLRQDLQLDQAGFAFREAVRTEQAMVYALAAHPDVAAAEVPLLSVQRATALSNVADALRAVWRLSEIDDFTLVHPRNNRRFLAAEPVEVLLGYYRAAAAQTGIDWSYLAAINFIESDFGRTNGPSTAGALGPMQFLPSTWSQYGRNGDIMSSRDAIPAAARLLVANGAPSNYDRAILHYNRDLDYVQAVKSYAAALRSDPTWLSRLHSWSTFG
jgi:membrane-bound lytic murein transglycosylase B